MADILATGHLDGSKMVAEWVDDEWLVQWIKDGDILAGMCLSEETVRELAALINRSLKERDKQ